jgi:C1q domain
MTDLASNPDLENATLRELADELVSDPGVLLALRQAITRKDGPVRNMAGVDILAAAVTGRVVVSPGQTISSSAWGNPVWDQSVNVFASAADRDTQWPTPHDGAVCYTLDTRNLWLRRAGAWGAFGMPHACRVGRSNAYAMPATANQIVYPFPFDSVIYNAESLFNPATFLYTCPLAGIYQVNMQMSVITTAAGQNAGCHLYRNGSIIRTRAEGFLANVRTQPLLSDAGAYNAGDTIGMGASTSLASANTWGANETLMSIAYLGPS